jgi:hypothetical protein
MPRSLRHVLLCGYVLWGLQGGVLSDTWVTLRSWPSSPTNHPGWWNLCDMATRNPNHQKDYKRLVCLPDTVDPRRR